MSDIFDEDLDMTLPEISPGEIRDWLRRRIQQGINDVGKCVNQWNGERDGSLPKGTFDPKKFEQTKRFAGLFKGTYDLLRPVIGEEAKPVDQLKVDDEFFSLMSDLYGYDVTKPREVVQ